MRRADRDPSGERAWSSIAVVSVAAIGRHLVALVLGLILFVMFLRSEAGSSFKPPDEDDGGGGGNDRVSGKPKNSPSGGIPLPDAIQSSFRLRSHERLRDAYRQRERRRGSEPARPSRRRVTG